MPLAVAAGRVVERSETVECSVIDGAQRDLIGRIPGAAVSHAGDGKMIVLVALVVAGERIPALEILLSLPRAVVGIPLATQSQFSGTDVETLGEQGAIIIVFAEFERSDALRQRVP